MSFIKIVTEPAILIITGCFLVFINIVLKNYLRTEKNLKPVYNFLKNLNKKEISYRFNELDEFMKNNSYTSTIWENFRKVLIFPEKFYTTSQNSNNGIPEIFLTADISYFFNEETLVYSKINQKFIQIMPTLLTGLGPFFTFLKMAIAFAAVNFSESMLNDSFKILISDIQMAALCSVFAVGFSLTFMFIEKILYNRTCKKYCLLIQKELIRLFDICPSEQFLLDLVKESKFQGTNNYNVLKALPENIASAISKSINENTTPYLENILYSLNKLNETMDKGSGTDVVDKLF